MTLLLVDLDPNLRMWALNLDQGGVMAIKHPF
jgi:hypothetical protein